MKNDSQFSPKEPGEADFGFDLGWAWLRSTFELELKWKSLPGAGAGALSVARSGLQLMM